MTRFLFLCLTLTSLSFASTDVAQQMDEVLKVYAKHELLNGTVLISHKGKVVFKGAYGYADMEWSIPNETDTRFRIGSVTKQFTAVLILKLVEQGKLDLQDTICDILPDYPKETGQKITVHHLLRHTSGIPNYTNREFFAKYSRLAKTPTEFLDYFKDKPLDFEPGTNWNYSNSAYFLLGNIIEKRSGKTYEAFLQEQILDPLGMVNTGYDNSRTILPKRARGYERSSKGLVNADFLDMSLPYAAGSMYSTVDDMFIWDRALEAGKVLPAELQEKMFTPGKNDYAYGWFVSQKPLPGFEEPNTLITHGGSINGFNALFTRYPSEGLAIAILNNTGSAPLNGIQRDLIKVLFGKEVTPPKPLASIEITRHLADGKLASTLEKILAQPDAYQIPEVLLNRLGYQLIEDQSLDTALMIFDFITKAFPESSNAFDSLAECQAKMGKKQEAIANYQRSLELDEGNDNARKQIEALSK